MVEAVEEGGFVDGHPGEEFGDNVISCSCICGAFCGLERFETNRFMMSNPISKLIDLAQLPKYISVVELD